MIHSYYIEDAMGENSFFSDFEVYIKFNNTVQLHKPEADQGSARAGWLVSFNCTNLW